MKYDVLIIGGGVSGMSCALLLGSAIQKHFALDKKIAIITHQKASALQNAVFNNVLGLPIASQGKDILEDGLFHLETKYPHIEQIPNQKVFSVLNSGSTYFVKTNKKSYIAKTVVIAVGASKILNIEGLKKYEMPHQKIPAHKERIQLKNRDHKVAEGLYVVGTLAGLRSQFAIAAGSGASVATDIITLWNDGKHTMIHDAIPKELR